MSRIAQKATMKCPGCAYENKPNAKICGLCQAPLNLAEKEARYAKLDWACVCGRANRPDATTCLACGKSRGGEPPKVAAAPAPAKSQLSPDQLLIDARARIQWGHSPELVKRSLVDNGFHRGDVDRFLAEAIAQRNAAFRWKGIRDLAIGGALLVACAVGFVLFATSRTMRSMGARSLTLVVLGLVSGCGLAFRGFWRLVLGGEGEGSI